jgi:hypothetical protein
VEEVADLVTFLFGLSATSIHWLQLDHVREALPRSDRSTFLAARIEQTFHTGKGGLSGWSVRY